MGIIKLRASALDAFAYCPRKFYYASFTSLTQIGSHAMALGTAVHAGLASFWQAKLDKVPKPTFEHALAAHDALEKEVETRVYDGLDQNKAAARAIFLTNWYSIQHEHSQDVPMAVEVALSYEIVPGVVVTGHPDLILREDRDPTRVRLVVVDHKVKKVAFSHLQADRLLQLTAYAVFLGLGWLRTPLRGSVDEMDCRLDNLVHGPMDQTFRIPTEPGEDRQRRAGQPRLVEIKTRRSAADVDTLKDFLLDVQARGGKQEHYPAKVTPLCQSCSYRLACAEGKAYLRRRNLPLLADLERLPLAA